MKFLIVSVLLIAGCGALPQRLPWGSLFVPVPGQQTQTPGQNQIPFQQQQQGQQQFVASPTNPFLNQPNGNINNIQPVDNDISTPAAPATTASPQFLDCMQRCPSTNEYNPICGTDEINYHNNGRLQCAISCGKSVSAVRAGTCRPL